MASKKGNTKETLSSYIKKYTTPSKTAFNLHDYRTHTHYKYDGKNKKEFRDIYCDWVFNQNKSSYLCERPLSIKHQNSDKDANILKIDIDLRFKPTIDDISAPKRRYVISNIKDVVKAFLDELEKYIDIPKGYRINIMEKENPKFLNDQKGSSYVKDGVHIVGEKLLIPNGILYKIRENVIQKENIIDIFKKMDNETPVSQVIDKCVIDKNPWFLYGSSKPDSTPYKVTHTYKVKFNDEGLYNLRTVEAYSNDVLFENMSNLFASDYATLKDGVDIDEINNTYHNNSNYQDITTIIHNDTIAKPYNNDIELRKYVVQLMELLNVKRANEYDSWWRVGQSLYNISCDNVRQFHEFSKRSDQKYNERKCNEQWQLFEKSYLEGRYRNCCLFTLRKMAEEDNENAYKKIDKNHKSILLKKIIEDMAQNKYIKTFCAVTFSKLTKEFLNRYGGFQMKCIVGDGGIGKTSWFVYKYDLHRWIEDKGGHEIDHFITYEYLELFEKLEKTFLRDIKDLESKACNVDGKLSANDIRDIEHQQLDYKNDQEIVSKIITYLQRKANHKEIKECLMTSYNDPDFYKKLNSNTKIFICKNGVLDLDKCEFRPGVPDDMMMTHTNMEYISIEQIYNEKIHGERYFDLIDYLKTFITEEDLRIYLLEYLALSLSGEKKPQKLAIFSGRGSNGKTTFFDDLVSHTFGQYFQKADAGILTRKRPDPNSPCEAIAALDGKRLVICEEPDQGSNLDTGVLKELTGGGSLTARHNFKPVKTFNIQYQMALLCNDKPSFKETDWGTMRRLLPIPVNSEYITLDSPLAYKLRNPIKYPKSFPADCNIQDKLNILAPYLLTHLFEIFKTAKKDKYQLCSNLPPVLQVEFDTYQRESNFYAAFKTDHIISMSGAKCSVNDAFNTFVLWGKNNNIRDARRISKKEFKTNISRMLHNTNPIRGYWKNFELVSDVCSDDDDDDDTTNITNNTTNNITTDVKNVKNVNDKGNTIKKKSLKGDLAHYKLVKDNTSNLPTDIDDNSETKTNKKNKKNTVIDDIPTYEENGNDTNSESDAISNDEGDDSDDE